MIEVEKSLGSDGAFVEREVNEIANRRDLADWSTGLALREKRPASGTAR
ncbi:MAG TPA: hypothetical protein VIP11_21345 [Gemmatimonadaceae bacterium]